ncbi:hypothetical protein A0256_03350 [Mucilaginibacter sp. PAMC 26640]|nr:hypothetical protein A0256_03350 [Mucilaginibacter sp. PAMC 26640]
MNLKNYVLLIYGLVIISAGCKKNDERSNTKESASELMGVDDGFQAKLTSINTGYQAKQVITIAGRAFERGFQDGKGSQALFESPWGIEMTQEGTLLVCDPANDKIRKVTTKGVVTPLNIPSAADGSNLLSPQYIRQGKDGTLAIKASEFKARYWIVKPSGRSTVTTGTRNGYYGSLAKDPYTDYYYTFGLNIGTNNVLTGFLEKVLPSGQIGVDAQDFPASSLNGDENTRNPTITPLYVGYNKVKYMVVNGNHIYKLTPTGELKQLFTNFNFESSIDDLIANKDSRTLYIASGGSIYSISNNKLMRLVGPNIAFDGRDGIGKDADVRAFNLALSNDENSLYFTDARYTVRKLILK